MVSKPRIRVPANGAPYQQPTTMVGLDDLDPFAYAGQHTTSPFDYSLFDGGKFHGGFGATQVQELDYWTLRARSDQLFNENLYARGLLRRLVTNEINTGLTPESCPDEAIIGLQEDALAEWTEDIENRFNVWGKNPRACDWLHQSTFGALQRAARMEALVSGDVLVVIRPSQQTGMPRVQLVKGSAVQSPIGGQASLRKGHRIKHGVELDPHGRVAAHWVRQQDCSYKRLPARGEKSGRQLSWLVYGTERRLDDVRGQPILSLVLQSLKEVDRYRDSAQRKAVINSILAMFIEKTEDKMSTLPVTGGAVRKNKTTVTDSDGAVRNFNIAKQIPGVVMEELQTGEKPVGFNNNGTDVAFGVFEEAIIQSVAWANEVPPEILKLAFSSNYSASQAAINEFKIYLNKVWSDWGETFCTPIYTEWLISSTLTQRVNSPGLLAVWRDPQQQDVFTAWTMADWYGSIKPSTDMLKQAKGSKMLVDECWSTNAREARITTGTKFSQNIKRLRKENALKVEAARPLAEFQQEFGVAVEDVGATASATTDDLEAYIDEYLGND